MTDRVDQPGGPLIPDYAGNRLPRTAGPWRSPEFLLRVAFACGGVSLVGGISIFGLWLLVRGEILQLLGVFWVLAGLVLVLAGAVSLVVCAVETRRSENVPPAARRSRLVRGTLAALLLLSNFPACTLVLAAVDRINSRFVVEVRNVGTSPITGAAVAYDGTSTTLDPIAPGATGTISIYAGGTGPVMLTTTTTTAPGTTSITLTENVDHDDLGFIGLTLHADVGEGTITSGHN